MRFYFSGEIDATVEDAYRSVRKDVEANLNIALADKSYGGVLDLIGIIPIILTKGVYGVRKERRLIKRSEKGADYRLLIDFNAFANGTEAMRKKLLIENVLKSVQDIDRKLKGLFDGKRLRDDILQIFPEAEYSS